MRTSSVLGLFLLLLGCPSAPPDPGGVILDDDDSGDDDDTGADDDDTGDDDDTADSLWAWAVLEHSDQIGPGGTVLGGSHLALAALGAGGGPPTADWGSLDGRPLVGATLHPDNAEPEGCKELSSDDGMDALPASDGVGGVVRFDGGGTSLELGQQGGLYSDTGGDPLGADDWDLVVKGGGGWPPATLPDAFALPDRPTNLLPGPGNVGNLAALEFKWDAPPSATTGVEIVMLRYTTANQTSWRAVRCRADDDGGFFVNASFLAAGTGSIEVILSRADWDTDGRLVDGIPVEASLGAVRSVRYTLTPG